KIPLRHQVCVDVVVGERAVFVWAGYSVDAKAALRVVVAERPPQPRCFNQQLEAGLAFERVVFCRRLATRHRVGDVCADVEGRRAGGPVPRAFLSANRSPWEGGALVAQLPGATPRRIERRVAPAEGVGGGVGDRIGGHRQNETCGIPQGGGGGTRAA